MRFISPPGPSAVSPQPKNTLANVTRDWRIYCNYAQTLMAIARRLNVNEPFGVELSETVYALDATTIDLSLSVFPWAPFRSTKTAIKSHTLLDLRGHIVRLFGSAMASGTRSTCSTS